MLENFDGSIESTLKKKISWHLLCEDGVYSFY